MADLAPVLKQRFFDANQAPLSGGLLYSYGAGSSTPLATYTDDTGMTPNTNPVVLDANGEADVWLGPATYKFVLQDADGVTQWTTDNVKSAGFAAAASAAAALASATAAAASATAAGLDEVTASRWAKEADGVTVVDATTLIDSGLFSAKAYAKMAADSAAVASGLPATSGTRTVPVSVSASGGLLSSTTAARQIQFVQGFMGPVTVTKNPAISAGTDVGQEIMLKGRSDTNTLTLTNGNGLSLNGDITLGDDDEIHLWWDSSLWQERSRRR